MRAIVLLFIMLIQPVAGALEIRHAPAADAKPWRDARESTFADRVKASRRNRPYDIETLALPHPHALQLLPLPTYVPAGSMPLGEGYDHDHAVWHNLPRQEIHAQYFEKRKALAETRHMDLVDWCEKNNLPELADFELRLKLSTFKSYQQAGYQPVKERWLKYGDQRQSEYAFPLPFQGEWTVAPDKTGHHRWKAGAAYAFDVMIVKKGAYVSGNPNVLANYFSWNQPVLAQADGVVVQVRDDQPDLPPGQAGAFDGANYVTVHYGGGILGDYAHLQQGSAKVKAGDKVTVGQTLALVGNSGASGYPHLHFTLRDFYGFSLRGRFSCEVQNKDKWDKLEGENLKEGTVVRNLEKK
jgi:hypothetical protein